MLERLAFAFIGGICGAVYGALIALAVFFFTAVGHPELIGWSIAVFACLGFFCGNFMMDVLLAFLHLVWGVLCAFSGQGYHPEDAGSGAHLQSFLLLGFGTGAVFLLWWWYL